MSNPAPSGNTPVQHGPTPDGSHAGRFEQRTTADSHFAWLRTRLALERTMLSWVRTAVSLIGFGFAIVQFFERLNQFSGANPERFPGAPKYLGLALIFCGVMALVVSVWQYRWTIRYLWSASFASVAGVTKEGRQTPILWVAALLAGIGVFAFSAVLLRIV